LNYGDRHPQRINRYNGDEQDTQLRFAAIS